MTSHEEVQIDLPDYAMSRLAADALQRVEGHVRGCEDCQEMVETIRDLAGALREGGEALFEPHPPESTLSRYARARPAAGMEGIKRHLDVCASCSLEVGAWSESAVGHPVPSRSIARFPRWASLALATAAGLAVGIGLPALLRVSGRPSPTQQSSAESGPARTGAVVGPLLVLHRALRGESASATYALIPDQAFVVIACPASIPDGAAPEQLYRYEIRREGAGVVWSSTITAAGIRRHLSEGAEVVTLLVPAASLTPGRYEFRFSSAGKPDEALYLADLELTGPR